MDVVFLIGPRFRGLIDDSGDAASDASSDALSDARYKQYIQIIYTPVSFLTIS